MRTVYTTRIDHVLPHRQQDALEALEKAVTDEFPDLYVHDWMLGDNIVAVLIAVHEDAEDGPDEPIGSDRLDGWGHGFLTLTLVGN